MANFFMCYYDGGCKDAKECKRSGKSGTKAEANPENQGWHIYERKLITEPPSKENCTGYMPNDTKP